MLPRPRPAALLRPTRFGLPRLSLTGVLILLALALVGLCRLVLISGHVAAAVVAAALAALAPSRQRPVPARVAAPRRR